MIASIRNRLRDPLTWTSASQLLKTVSAVVIAWALAANVFGISQPFLAPWAALLTVQATVLGSLRRGATQAAATLIGVLVAFGAGRVFEPEALALATAVLIGLLVGSIRRLRADSATAAATAIVVLTTGYSDDGGMLAARLLDTGIGIAVACSSTSRCGRRCATAARPLRSTSSTIASGSCCVRWPPDCSTSGSPRSTTGSPVHGRSTRRSPRRGACSVTRRRAGG
jgi:uncharacterized membrane protein YccC